MIRIGILGGADIAKRRFLPALQNATDLYEFAGVASATDKERTMPLKMLDAQSEFTPKNEDDRMLKATALCEEFGGKVYESYEALINDPLVDAIYIPLPPALHYYWGKKSLEAGKHVYMEKPFTVDYRLTKELVTLAEEKNLALFENYGFTFNDQVKVMDSIVNNQEKFGSLRLIRGYFGFPKRPDSDFRYNRKLGGGAVLDCGGYTIRLARHFMGDDLEIMAVNGSLMPGHDVDGWGSVMARNKDGAVCQLSYGMDNQYKCECEIWGSIGTIYSPRVFTPPPAYEPSLTFTDMSGAAPVKANAEDAFLHGQHLFAECVSDTKARDLEYWEILNQGRLVDELLTKTNNILFE